MNKIQCLLVDDEPPAIKVLQSYIQSLPNLQIAGTCNHALAAFDFLNQQKVDLMFLDIQMPRLSGIDFIRSLAHPPKIILTTAYKDFAFEAYELDVIDYLLKPISFERFLKAVQKITQSDVNNSNLTTASVKDQNERFLFFRANRKMTKVYLDNILYAESLKDYVKIFTTENIIIPKMTIQSLEELLPENIFLRVHRSFIVAVPKIESYTLHSLFLANHEIPIGPMYRNEVAKRIRNEV